jgi:hypothetical protein
MNNITLATVTVKGVRPLFWHKFGPDALPLEKQERTGVAGNDPEEWRKTVLVTKTGQLYLEASYAFGALREAARYTKKNRGSIQSAVSATLQVTDDRILVDRFFPGWPKDGQVFNVHTQEPPDQDFEAPVYLDVRGVRNPATKGRNVRYRIASSTGWICSFHLQFDKTIVSRAEMEAVVIDAGRLVGLGNGRAIGMGRFDVVSFDAT